MNLRDRIGRGWTTALAVVLASGALWVADPAAAQTTAVETEQAQPVVEQPVVETPTEAQPLGEQPLTQQPLAEQPLTEQPAAVETAPAHAEAHDEHAGGAGMPQLNPETFPPQLIWLAITFIALYLLMSRVALPRIGAVLDERRERISDDLDKATQLRQDAEEVLAEYEQGLASARSEAQSIARSVAEEISAASAAAQEELGQELAQQTREAETRIAAAKQAALENVRSIAVDVAQAATARLIGEDVASGEVEQAVEATMGQRG